MGKRNPAQITLKDIAGQTGYSINTVSHALKNKPDISEAARARIRRAAEELGYVGNALAESMRTGCTRTVALILGDIANPHFALIACDAERTMRAAGYNTTLYNTEEDPELELHAIRSAVAQKADGILICPTQRAARNLHYLKQCGVPFALVGRCFPGESLPGAVPDDVLGGRLATQHLLVHGHRRILLLDGPDEISSARQRRQGYESALADAGIPVDPARICPVPISMGRCSGQMDAVLRRGADFTAMVAFSDMVALEAVTVLNRCGLRVPDDVSVVGFDNILAQFPLPVLLDSVGTVGASMASCAAQQLIALMRGEPQEPVVLPVAVAARGSVRAV